MSRFGFTTGNAFRAGLTASDRRFRQSALESERRTQEAILKGYQDLEEFSLETQKKLAEDQAKYMKAIEDAITFQTEAQEDFQKFATDEAEKQTKRLEEISTNSETLAMNLQRQVEEVSRRLDIILGLGPNGTAGGPVGRVSRFGPYINGQVWSTGDVKLWHRHEFYDDSGILRLYLPAGWLVCDGTSFEQQQYPELAAVLGATYLGSHSPGYWLPTKAELTGDSVILDNTKLDFLIRT